MKFNGVEGSQIANNIWIAESYNKSRDPSTALRYAQDDRVTKSLKDVAALAEKMGCWDITVYTFPLKDSGRVKPDAYERK